MAIILKLLDYYKDSSDRDKILELSNKELIIGRSSTSDLKVNDPRCSKHHFSICIGKQRIIIKDLESKNGTFINNCRVSQTYLYIQDKIRIGRSYLGLDIEVMTEAERKLFSTPIEFTGSRSAQAVAQPSKESSLENFYKNEPDGHPQQNFKKPKDFLDVKSLKLDFNSVPLKLPKKPEISKIEPPRKTNLHALKKKLGKI